MPNVTGPPRGLLSSSRSCFQPQQLRTTYIVALVFTQVANVVGALYLKVAMNSSSPPHPVTFALYRELMAGIILTVFATGIQGNSMKPSHIPTVAALGLCLFLNQLLFILGLNLAGVTLASCMQPAIPVFTALLSMLCRQECVSSRRVAGTIVAALGATAMVYGSSLRVTGHVPPMDNPGKLLEDVSNTLPERHALRSLSMFSEWSKPHGIMEPLRQHLQEGLRTVVQEQLHAAESHAHSINGCTHQVAADAGALPWPLPGSSTPVLDCVIGRGTLGSEAGPELGGDRFLGALCLVGNCAAMAGYFVLARRISGDVPATALTGWAYLGAATWMALVATITVPKPELILPASSHGPLLYWVVIVSILGYSILTSATSVLEATHVAAFISVQPLAGAVLGWAAFGEQVHAWDSGALFIVMGLFLVTYNEAARVNAVEHSSQQHSRLERVV